MTVLNSLWGTFAIAPCTRLFYFRVWHLEFERKTFAIAALCNLKHCSSRRISNLGHKR